MKKNRLRLFCIGAIATVWLTMFGAPISVFAQTPPITPTPAATPATADGCESSGTTVPIKLSVQIGAVTQVTSLGDYVNTAYKYLASVVLVVAIIMVVYGGFIYLVGSAGISSIQRGKQIIKDALLGMVVVLVAYSILNVVNSNTTKFTLNPPSVACEAYVSRAGNESGANANILACVKDSQCNVGRVCIRTMFSEGISSGQCSQGKANELCHCSGTGCDVTASEDGGPTNNGGTKLIACQEGTCQEISGIQRCLTGASGSVCDMNADPQIPCAAGKLCQQGDSGEPGRCTSGDYHDAALSPSPVCSNLFYGTGGGERYYREKNIITTWEGGCRRPSGSGVDEFCMSHRYKCSNAASNPNRCSEEDFSAIFWNTGAAYSWNFATVPEKLRPSSYMRSGCHKSIGASCTINQECPSMCIGGVCTGFCALVASTDDRVSGGALPAGVSSQCTTSRCGDDTWSPVDLLANHSGYPVSDANFASAFGSISLEKAACYPLRPTASKCDFNGQCTSGNCSPDPGRGPTEVAVSELLHSFQTPQDNATGLGTCAP